MASMHLLAGIAWDPQIRGFLAVAVGVVVLLGSIHLLLATNLGNRLGFFVASAAFWGWLFIMGSVWWVYGNVGMLGTAPHWVVTETVYPGLEQAALEEARDLDTSVLPAPEAYHDLDVDEIDALRAEVEGELAGWELLPESNPSFGEAKATVDEHFAEHPDEELDIDSSEDYVSVYAFERGGKEDLPDDPSRWDRVYKKLKSTFWELRHPPRHAIIQVHRVVNQEAEPGQPPPRPIADESTPVVSVILERDLGDVRFPGAMLTIASGIMFGLTCMALHRRDQLVAQARGLVPATTEG